MGNIYMREVPASFPIFPGNKPRGLFSEFYGVWRLKEGLHKHEKFELEAAISWSAASL